MAIARKRGTYSVPDVIDVTNDDDDCDDNEDVAAEESTTSPVTMPSVLLSSPEAVSGGANTVTTAASSMQDDEDSCDGLLRNLRKTQKQASVYKHVKKKVKMEDDGLYKAAFKAATTLAAAKINSDSSRSMDSVDVICDKFNEEYGLAKEGTNRRLLARATVYRAVEDGLAGKSPKKKGPAPKIPDKLLQVVALHAEMCQVGSEGELRGRDIKRCFSIRNAA